MMYLVCEGGMGMLDDRVLRLIIVNHYHKNLQIAAVGGETSLRSVARWLEDRSGQKDRAYVVEDRNFRPLSEVEKVWQTPQIKHVIWRRHEIENYLLDPRIIAHACRSLKTSSVKAGEALPTTAEEIVTILKTLAHPLLEDHVGNITFDWVRKQSGQFSIKVLGPDKKTLLSRSSPNAVFPDQTGWFGYFQQEEQRLRQACEDLLTNPQWNFSVIEQFYRTTLTSLNTPEFWEEQIFLQELGGHELLSQLLQYFHREVQFHISYADLTEELLKSLDQLYQPGFFQPDDFQELVSKLQ